jgi:hypothetical protein
MEPMIAPAWNPPAKEVDLVSDREREGGACPLCLAPARLLTCWACCDSAWVIECAHRSTPPPMIHGRSDGSDRHRVFCTECAEA